MNQLWFRKKNKVTREPLYKLSEIAAMVGMEHKVILGYLRGRKEGAPKPVSGPKADLSGKYNLYKLSEFKAWIKTLDYNVTRIERLNKHMEEYK